VAFLSNGAKLLKIEFGPPFFGLLPALVNFNQSYALD